jgi:predicted CXXCH cytochrome family protein
MGEKKYVHRVGVDPNACDRCHTIIQQGEHRFMKIPEKTAELCAQCHNRSTSVPPDFILLQNPPKMPFSGEDINWHKPFAEGKCTICHDAHESNYFKHLKAEYPETPYASYSPDTYRMCFTSQCHQGLLNVLEEPRILSGSGFRNGNLNLHYKHVNKEKGRTCRTCHRLHGSAFPDLMTKSFKFGTRELSLEYMQTETGGSCMTPCHKTALYDRYEPVFNVINSSTTPGKDATKEELDTSRVRDLQERHPQTQ